SYNMFTDMLERLNEDILSFLLRAFIPLRDADDAREARPAQRPQRGVPQMRTNDPSQLTTNGQQQSRMPIRVDKQVGRNDPCPCGSGLKYKNCHGKGQL
ncbi:MAG: SEC-C domain-containing protein, partial [Bacteroidales bacterium]|nr:SEC-C domain-containing protein [Bacteroidales bacterium]